MMQDLRIPSLRRGPRITILVNGRPVEACEGETVLAALIAANLRILKHSHVHGEARGALCGMGVCYECLVSVNGQPNQRACMIEVRDRMEIAIDGPQEL